MRVISRLPAAACLAVLFSIAAMPAAGQEGTISSLQGPESNGRDELTAYAASYPGRISGLALRTGEWSVEIDGEWFSWAHGRMLPETLRDSWTGFAAYRFYQYTVGPLPPLPVLDEETVARLQKRLKEDRSHPPRRSEAFLETLYHAGTRRETEQHLVTVDFLGFRVQVHEIMADALKAVAADCQSARTIDPSVASFFAGLTGIDGYNYRDVAGTLSRSYHSYGLALDMIPRSYSGRAPYWRWVMVSNDRWWETPYARRWPVPQAVVDAFEHHGFIWGGKWLFFDTMHFEYRPEIQLVSRAGA